MNLRNQNLSRQKVVLTDNEVNVLGPDLILDECSVCSECSAEALVIAGLRMNGGVFEQKSPLSNFHFERAHLDGVSFFGSYSGCDFGDWDTDQNSSIANANFANARLDGCRFLNCDARTILFPRWPCFTIIDPSAARQFVMLQAWPGRLGGVLDLYTDQDPECMAITGDAERIAKKYGLSLLDLKKSLETIPGILLDD